MAAWQFAKMLHTADANGWTRFVTMQNHYNLIYREEEREMNPLCIDQGVGLIPWSPLARGFFAHSRRPGDGGSSTKRAETDEFGKRLYNQESDLEIAAAVADVAKERGVSPTQIACAWIVQAPGVAAPIIGATKTNHLKELIEAVEIKLTPEELAALEKPYRPHPVVGHEQPDPRRMASAHS
jgi:aryl-alcohol dehydrogenase (NADP+)